VYLSKTFLLDIFNVFVYFFRTEAGLYTLSIHYSEFFSLVIVLSHHFTGLEKDFTYWQHQFWNFVENDVSPVEVKKHSSCKNSTNGGCNCKKDTTKTGVPVRASSIAINLFKAWLHECA